MSFSDMLLVTIRERLNYEEVFAEFVVLRGRGPERTAKCIFHEDSTPSMSVNVEDGVYFCHNPSCAARGDIFAFYMRVRSLTFQEAVQELARRAGVDPDGYKTVVPSLNGNGHHPTAEEDDAAIARHLAQAERRRDTTREPERVIDERVVDAMHDRLLATPSLMQWLAEKRGLNEETIKAYKLGHDGQRYYIPIRNADGQCVNIRRYKPGAARAQEKMISWRQGYGSARLFPVEALGAEPESDVLVVEGEMDCLLARQMGLNAVTTTGGAGTWRDTWNELFRERTVVVCYDADEAGRIGAAHVATQLVGVAASVKIVEIPLSEPKGADFTDYVVGHGHTREDFERLISNAPFFRPEPGTRATVPAREPVALHLSQASKAEYTNVPVKLAVMVSGKTTAPYIVPREVKMSCSMPGLKMCERCPVASAGGMKQHRMEFETNEVLQFTDASDERVAKMLKAKVGVPTKCGYVRPEVIESMNVEEVQLIPEIERTEEDAPYVTRAAFYMGHGLQSNRSYLMTGITVPEPKRQLATHLIHTAVPSQSNIDAFHLTEDVVGRLRTFQPTEQGVRGLWVKLGAIYEDLERHTRIYQRRDLMLAVDLTFHSVLRFSLQGDLLTRGWVEALIIGDSRTGKTTVVERMMQYYGAGEMTTGENTTLAGLVGGLHQVGNSWALQWGRIPLNDRRELTIDEMSSMPIEHIGRMSAMRSSGIAEVIKVHTERTNARTRKIWISNCRRPMPLSSYSQGVLAVKELVGAPEDIARFDIVAAAASGDVPIAVVNAHRGSEIPTTFSRDICHQRVMWAWSRTADQVHWLDGAVDELLRVATEQGERYRFATEIPLVEPNEQRVKLARLAVAAAVMFFSASDDGQIVQVSPDHVRFVEQYTESLYQKPSLSFTEYAAMQKRRYEIASGGGIEAIVRRNPSAIRSLMEQEQFTQRDLQEILAINDRDDLRDAVTKLREGGFLRRIGSSFYVKTPAAILWLRRELTETSGDQVNFAELMSESGDAIPSEPPW